MKLGPAEHCSVCELSSFQIDAKEISVLLHFRTPSIVIDDSSWKNAAECFTVALTLTLGQGGTKVQ